MDYQHTYIDITVTSLRHTLSAQYIDLTLPSLRYALSAHVHRPNSNFT